MYFNVNETEMCASVNKQSVGGSFLTKQSKGVSRERDASEVSVSLFTSSRVGGSAQEMIVSRPFVLRK